MARDSDLVVAAVAPDGTTAQLIAAILRDAGIPAHVSGTALQDEWAMSQKMMGLLASEVRVPRDRLEEARAAIAAAREAGSVGADEARDNSGETEPPAEAPDRGSETETGPPATSEAPAEGASCESGRSEEAEGGTAPGEAEDDGTVSGLPRPGFLLRREDAEEPEGPEKRTVRIELGVVLFALVLPSVFFALMDALVGGEYWGEPPLAAARWAQGMVLELAQCAILLYLVFRWGEPWARIGLVMPRWLPDLAGGAGLFVLGYVLDHTVVWALFPGGGTRPSYPPYRGLEVAVVVVSTLVSVFTQELLFRGYLISRIERIMGSPGWAILLSAALFAGVHSYQGWDGVVASAITALVFGLIFAVGGRLWPLVVAHAAQNLVAVFVP